LELHSDGRLLDCPLVIIVPAVPAINCFVLSSTALPGSFTLCCRKSTSLILTIFLRYSYILVFRSRYPQHFQVRYSLRELCCSSAAIMDRPLRWIDREARQHSPSSFIGSFQHYYYCIERLVRIRPLLRLLGHLWRSLSALRI